MLEIVATGRDSIPPTPFAKGEPEQFDTSHTKDD
jgi:hypothetical protein